MARSAWIVAAAFLAGHELLPRVSDRAWGFDSLVGLTGGERFAWAAAAAVAAAVAARIGRRPLDPWASPRRAGIFSLALATAALGLFLGLRSAVPLLGDGRLRLRDLDQVAELNVTVADIAAAEDNAPLGHWLVHAAHRSGAARHASPGDTYRIVTAIAGCLYVLLSVAVAARFGRSPPPRWIVLGFLLTVGALALFCGYVEIYAPLFPAFLAYVLITTLDLRRARLPWRSALALGGLITLHFTSVALVPSLLLVAVQEARSRGIAAARATATLAVTALTVTAIFGLLGFPWHELLRADPGPRILPLLSLPGHRETYRLFDPAHLLDVANLLVLVAPAAVLGLVVAHRVGDRDPIERFLASAAVPSLLLLFLANPEIGAFRDWDILSFTTLPFTLWIAYRVAHARGRAGAAPIIAAAAVHTLAWTALNTSAVRSEARFARLLEHAAVSDRGRGYGWETLARHRLDDGRTAAALDAIVRATDAVSDNPRLWINRAQLHLAAGDRHRARASYLRARELQPDGPEAHSGLGKLAFDAGNWEEALPHARRAVELRPADARSWFHLALVRVQLEQWPEARSALLAALHQDPGFAPALYQLGRVHRREGNDEAARAVLRRALELQPEGAFAAEARSWLAGP